MLFDLHSAFMEAGHIEKDLFKKKNQFVFMGINEAVNHVGLKGREGKVRQKSPYKLLSSCLISSL